MRVLRAAAAIAVLGAGVALLIGSCKSVATVAPSGAALTLFASPGTVALNGTAALSLTIFELSGQPVPDGTLINFTTTLGSVVPASITTTGGYAQATFYAPAERGTATITASSGGTSDSTTVFVGGMASTISLTAQPARLPLGGGTTTLVATVRDAGGAAAAGVIVTFTTDRGTLASGGRPIATDSSGQAADVLTTTVSATVHAGATVEVPVGATPRPPRPTPTAFPSSTLTPTPTETPIGGGVTPTPTPTATPTLTPTPTSSGTPGPTPTPTTLSAQVTVIVEGSGATLLKVTATPATLPSGGGSSALQASALDAASSPVASYPILFTTNAGTLASNIAIRTNASGIASNTLTTTSAAMVTATGPGATPAMVSVNVGSGTPTTPTVKITVSPARVDRTLDQQGLPVAACGNDPNSVDLTLTATAKTGTTPLVGALVLFTVDKVTKRAERIVGRFCEFPGDPAYTTDANGVATVHYALSKSDRLVCDNVVVPCQSASCGVTMPCGLATPMPSPPPTLSNDCCCGLKFTAQLGSVSSVKTVPVLVDQDCTRLQSDGTPYKLCACPF